MSQPSPTRIHLVRHGEVAVDYHRVFGGRIDMDLSPNGRHQAELLAAYLHRRPVSTYYVSPMKRARQTLEPLLTHRQIEAPAGILQGMREVDFGDWTGLSWEQVQARFQSSAFDWLDLLEQSAIPGAESVEAFRHRVESELRPLLEQHRGGEFAIVCHGGVVRMCLSLLLHLPLPKTAHFEVDYASLTTVELRPHRAELRLLNFAPWKDLH